MVHHEMLDLTSTIHTEANLTSPLNFGPLELSSPINTGPMELTSEISRELNLVSIVELEVA